MVALQRLRPDAGCRVPHLLKHKMHIVIASRIYSPEPAAASFMLEAIAREFHAAGNRVTVITSAPPQGLSITDHDGIAVKRAPVLRDRNGYVRGYFSYLSFDIPLFFRLLFGPRADAYLLEPPPTTAAVVRIVSWLRRTPYVYDAADLWSDAARMVTSSRFVLWALRGVELFGLRGAEHAFAISDGLISRVRELGVEVDATAIGFGVNPEVFHYLDSPAEAPPYFVYAGSYSEWHGAGIFIDAFAQFVSTHPNYRLIFVGNGAERSELEVLARQLGIHASVEFRDPVEAAELNGILATATASLASLKPGQGYDYAFTTKAYSSLAAGCPVLFTGVGPTVEFMHQTVARYSGGVAVPYEVGDVLQAMTEMVKAPLSREARAALSEWARQEFSIAKSARTVVDVTTALLSRPIV